MKLDDLKRVNGTLKAVTSNAKGFFPRKISNFHLMNMYLRCIDEIINLAIYFIKLSF